MRTRLTAAPPPLRSMMRLTQHMTVPMLPVWKVWVEHWCKSAVCSNCNATAHVCHLKGAELAAFWTFFATAVQQLVLFPVMVTVKICEDRDLTVDVFSNSWRLVRICTNKIPPFPNVHHLKDCFTIILAPVCQNSFLLQVSGQWEKHLLILPVW